MLTSEYIDYLMMYSCFEAKTLTSCQEFYYCLPECTCMIRQICLLLNLASCSVFRLGFLMRAVTVLFYQYSY